jgi:RND family efflux transporter MFP subunit
MSENCSNFNLSISEKIVGTAAMLESIANFHIFKPLGLSLQGFKILLMLEKFNEQSTKDLIEKLNNSKSNISQRLDYLEKKCYIKRNQNQSTGDKRMISVSITADGREILKKARVEIGEKSLEVEKFFSEDEIKIHHEFLNKLIKILIKHKEEACEKINCMKKNIIILALAMTVVLSGCGTNNAETAQQKSLAEVKSQKVSASKSVRQTVEYPAMVSSEQEAKIVAKTSGTAKGVRFNVGDRVSMGQEIFRIDDINSGSNSSSGFNASQIKQASIGTEQAAAAFNLAQKNYDSLLLSSQRDLAQAEIGKEQSDTGRSNLSVTASESLKSAQLAYDSAKIAREQAKNNLDSRKSISGQSSVDTNTNSSNSADSAAAACGTIITSINNIASLDEANSPGISYKNNLGVLDFNTITNAKNAYLDANTEYRSFLTANFSSTNEKIDVVILLAQKTKKLADAAKLLFDKTISSDALPQSSSLGASLSGLQAAVSGYQVQASGALSQANGAKQALVNIKLGNDATLDTMQKAYELAVKQEASAKQNLDNLKVGNKSQLDNAGYGVDSAVNQFEATKIRINSQLSVSKSQLDIARLSYNNALISLQGLFDIHKAVSPIDGIITRKFVDEADTVSPGQVLATVSQSDKVKLELYVNQEDLAFLLLGQGATIKDNNGKAYEAIVSGITPAADSVTKRFLVEVKPKINNPKIFAIGTIMNVTAAYDKKPSNTKNIILPLTAVEIGQNANNIMILDNGKVKKAAVEIVKVQGEAVEVKTGLSPDTEIIVDGNKIVEEGEEVKIKN